MEWAFRLEKEKMGSAISQNVAVLRQWTGLLPMPRVARTWAWMLPVTGTGRDDGDHKPGANDGGRRGPPPAGSDRGSALARVLTVKMDAATVATPSYGTCACLPRAQSQPTHHGLLRINTQWRQTGNIMSQGRSGSGSSRNNLQIRGQSNRELKRT